MLRFAPGLIFLTIGAVTHYAGAQKCGSDAQSTIATDRPQFTSSSVVVPCGSLQFENGFLVTGNGGQQTTDFPETSVRFGVLHRTELRLGVPDYFYNFDTGAGFTNGFGDMNVGFKQQLGPLAKFDVSIIPSVSLPTGAHLISSHGYDPTVQLPWSRALAKSWTIAGMFSVSWPTQSGRRNRTGQASMYFDRQLTAPWDAYVEYSGSFPERGGPQHYINTGTSYKLSPRQQLDFHVIFGLSAATPDYQIGLGYSFRIQAIHAK
ncbi:MAG: transporter [Silvibacterium sp.]|nr:transporter [Silvibacterium sp.]